MERFTKRIQTEVALLKANCCSLILLNFFLFYFCSLPARNLVFFLDKPSKSNPMEDLAHNWLPEVKTINIQDYPQTFTWLFAANCIIFLPLFFQIFHDNKISSVNNYLVTSSLLALTILIRLVSVYLTIVPDPSYLCQEVGSIPKPHSYYGKIPNI